MLILLAALGCQVPVMRRDWSSYTGPGAEAFRKEQLPPLDFPDPLEPWNRSASLFNHGVMMGVINPLATVYRALVPVPIRTGLENFSTNLLYPRRVLANLLQGKLPEARDETYRFGVNTTVGILGLFDPASRWGIPLTDQDFGQVFAAWGWRPSTYFVIPLFGPSTVRDTAGLVPDTATNPLLYASFVPFIPIGSVLTFNEQADLVVPYKRFTRTTHDPYHLGRLLWMLDRESEIDDPVARARAAHSAAVQTLEVLFLSYRDPQFPDCMRERSVRGAGGHELPYSYRLQPGTAPIVFLLPGLGAHRLDRSSLALAEMVYARGFSVVVVSSPMNWEFIRGGASTALPGYTPVDVHDVHFALDAINRDLEARYPGRFGPRVLMGYSLGAFHTLFIAASAVREPDNPSEELVGFDRYVSIDAPVQLLTGLQRLDAYYNAPLEYPKSDRDARVRDILERTVALAKTQGGASMEFSRIGPLNERQDHLRSVRELPFTDLEARYLIGLDFRLILVEILSTSQDEENLGVLETPRSFFRRESAYAEMASYSFEQYLYAFVLPYMRDRLHLITGVEELMARSDLRSVAAGLRSNPKIRHFANVNDFVTTQADITWITDTLGAAHVRLFPSGGHLGNLDRPDVQREIMESIEDLAPATP